MALNDGGMSRNGIDMTTEAGKLEAVELANSESVEVVGIMTHFPNYDAEEVEKLAEFKQSSSWLIETQAGPRQHLITCIELIYSA